MMNMTRRLRKLSVLALTLGALVLLAGCSGKTTGTTDITHVSAKLHATGRCDAGQTCTWYWEYWPEHLPRYFDSHQVSKTTPVQGPVRGASADIPLSTVITGLESNTTYRWVFCGSPNNGADYVCVGPHGKGGSTTADPPPDYETFSTPPLRRWQRAGTAPAGQFRPPPTRPTRGGTATFRGHPARPPRRAPPSATTATALANW